MIQNCAKFWELAEILPIHILHFSVLHLHINIMFQIYKIIDIFVYFYGMYVMETSGGHVDCLKYLIC